MSSARARARARAGVRPVRALWRCVRKHARARARSRRPSPVDALAAQAVNAAIEALSEDLRQAITLREIEGLSYEEIADMMNCPIGTVRSRIFRAREAIAQRLRPLLDTRAGERW